MATITPVLASTTGAAVVYAAASGGGDSLVVGNVNPGAIILRINNAAVSGITVTLTGVAPCSQGSTHNQVISVGATTEVAVLINPAVVNTTTGNVAIAYSAVTTVTVCATRLA